MIDTVRHVSLFNPNQFEENVHVVGCGATGSRIAHQLARLGIKPSQFHLWDDDIIEAHNIANQTYWYSGIENQKAFELSIDLYTMIDIDIPDNNIHDEKLIDQPITGIIFLCTDTMASRKEIWNNCIKMKPGVKLMIETRMGADSLRLHTINPINFEHITFWEGTLYEDDEAVVSACGARTTVGATAEVISGLAVWELIKYQNDESVGAELIMGLKPEPILLHNKI